MSPKVAKFRLLLDEMFPARNKFPELNKYHNLRHIAHDFKMNGATDEKVVKLAAKENRSLISKNGKHMINLCQELGVKLIITSETMSDEEIDSKIMASLRKTKTEYKNIKIAKSARK